MPQEFQHQALRQRYPGVIMESVEITDSKIRARYRYPDSCCGRCIHAYQSTYGDYQCTKLAAGNSIDLGAICDHYHEEITDERG